MSAGDWGISQIFTSAVSIKLQFVTDKRTTVRTKHVAERKEVTALVETKILPMPNIKNVFLDDDLLSEVRICQAM